MIQKKTDGKICKLRPFGIFAGFVVIFMELKAVFLYVLLARKLPALSVLLPVNV